MRTTWTNACIDGVSDLCHVPLIRFTSSLLPAVLVVVQLPCWNVEVASAQGPIPAPIIKGDLTVTLEDFVRMPQTGNGAAGQARINFLREEPGGADRLFVNDLNGFLYTVDEKTREVSTYIDFTSEFPHFKTAPGMASGHVTFTFHPDFATNGRFYTVHSENLDGRTSPTPTMPLNPPLGSAVQHGVLMEWTATDPAANVFDGTRREIMRVGTPGWWHPMGDLGFHPLSEPGDEDYGLLYIAVGDGQSFHQGVGENAQRLDSYLGKILRIDPNPQGQPTISKNGQYSLPESNPLAADANPDSLDEIYASGFRNPHRISWDTVTGHMFAAEIGEHAVEEINLIQAGRNYGWPEREGTFLLGGAALPPNDATFGFSYPVAQFDHDEGTPTGNTAVSSGFVYRGTNLPQLHGKYVFGEIASGRIFYSDIDDLIAAHDDDPRTTAAIHELQLVYQGVERDLIDVVAAAVGEPSIIRTDLRLAIDAEGELYATTKQDGFIRKLVTHLTSGDANTDLQFDQQDLVQVQIAGKYLTGRPATWREGDWNGAPGGSVSAPPEGDGVFDQFDIIAAQVTGNYLTGPYTAVLQSGGPAHNIGTSVGYDARTGEIWVEAPSNAKLTSIGIESAAGIFTGSPATNLGGGFDIDTDQNIFKTTFGTSFGSISFGHVAQTGLSMSFVLDDLNVMGSLAGGGELGAARVIYVPVPRANLLAALGATILLAIRRRNSSRKVL